MARMFHLLGVLLVATAQRAAAQETGDSRFVVGLSIGPPIAVSPMIGVEHPLATVRLTGAYYGEQNKGLQLALGPRISEKKGSHLEFLVAVGASKSRDEWGDAVTTEVRHYVGVGGCVVWRWLFAVGGAKYDFYRTSASTAFSAPSNTWHDRLGTWFSFGLAFGLG